MSSPRASSATSSLFRLASGLCILAISAGCAGGLRPRPVPPVPEFRYPGDTRDHNLQLVSVLADPLGVSWRQGGATDELSSGQGFAQPVALVTTAPGVVNILDRGAGVVIRLSYDPSGRLTRREILDRDGHPFPSAVAMAATPDGGLWVSDTAEATVSRFAPDGRFLGEIRGFGRPVGVVWHPGLERMIVADLVDNALHMLKGDGQRDMVRDADTGLALEAPSFLAVGPRGEIYVVEALSARIRCLGPDWRLVSTIGSAGDGPGHFAKPKGVAADTQGRVYVMDALFDNMQVFDATGVLLLTLGATGHGIGEFWQPSGVSLDTEGRIYIADTYNRRVQVFSWEEDATP